MDMASVAATKAYWHTGRLGKLGNMAISVAILAIHLVIMAIPVAIPVSLI